MLVSFDTVNAIHAIAFFSSFNAAAPKKQTQKEKQREEGKNTKMSLVAQSNEPRWSVFQNNEEKKR